MGWFKIAKNDEANKSHATSKLANEVLLKNMVKNNLEEFNPQKYDQVELVANALILGKSIRLNLNDTLQGERRRIIDFLCGIAFVLDLDVKYIDNNIYEFIK